jgi:hypothetical protein
MELDEQVLALLERHDSAQAATVLLEKLGAQLLDELRALAPGAGEDAFDELAVLIWRRLGRWQGTPPLAVWTRQLLWEAAGKAQEATSRGERGGPPARRTAAQALEALDQEMGGGFFTRVATPGPETFPPRAPPDGLPDMAFLHLRKLRGKG